MGLKLVCFTCGAVFAVFALAALGPGGQTWQIVFYGACALSAFAFGAFGKIKRRPPPPEDGS
ncbi:MAG: hypothetical protein ACE5JG_01885 [Planctomycetota bacterium]